MSQPNDPYSFAAWCRESLVDFTKLNAEKQVFIGFVLAIVVAACVKLIETTTGLPSVYEHLIYIPLLFAGLLLGPRIGALGGFVCGIALSPLSFADAAFADSEISTGWLLRLLLLTLMPLIAGLIANSVKDLVALEKKAKHTYQGTELPNMAAFVEQLKSIGNEEDADTKDLVDIFNFKLQNMERIQHQIGTERTEKLMRQLAEQLRNIIGKSAHIGQTSNNELVGVSTDTQHTHKELEQKLKNLLERPIVIDGVPYQLDSATGVLRTNRGQVKDKTEAIVEQAQHHAFEAREQNKDFSFLEHDDAIESISDVSFSRQLTEAIERNDIRLHYQPRLNANTGYFSVLEAIVKWTDPKRGDMTADEFRPLIEEAALNEADEGINETIKQLSELDVAIIIDDFGTGFSSLNYLADYPIDTVKIDRSLIQNLADNERTQRIVAAMIKIAQAAGVDVIAEGIENERQLELIQQLGCQRWQGHLIHPAKPVDELNHLD